MTLGPKPKRIAAVAGLLVLAVAGAARAEPAPILGATLVNPDATVDAGQSVPGVAMDSQGRFVVTYDEVPSSGPSKVFAQRFDAAQQKVGERIPVAPSVESEHRPSISMAPDGRFAVAMLRRSSGFADQLVVQRFAADGAPVGGVLTPASTNVDMSISTPPIAMASDGSFAVAWVASVFPRRLKYRRYGADGTPLTGELDVTPDDVNSEAHPAIGMASDGRFVITWHKSTTFGSTGVVPARLFKADGTPVAAQFEAFVGAMNLNYKEPAAAMAPDGRFAIAWMGPEPPNFEGEIFARRFDAAANPSGDAFRANDYAPYRQASPAATLDAAGNLLLAYEGQVGTQQWSYLRQFGPDGAPVGLGQQTGTAPSGSPMRPAVATDGAARSVTAFLAHDTPSSFGIFVRRFDYAPIAPAPQPGPDPTPTPSPGPTATSRPSPTSGPAATNKPGPPRDRSRTCGERTKPRSSISDQKRVFTRGRLSLFGRTTDRDCTANGTDVRAKRPLERVEVSVGTRAKGKKQCLFLQSSGKLSEPRPCSRPIYIRARAVKFQGGKTTWSLSKPVGLQSGSYTAIVRALDREGNTEVAKRRTNRAQFTVR